MPRRPKTRLGVPNTHPHFPHPIPLIPQFAAATPRRQTSRLGVGNTDCSNTLTRLSVPQPPPTPINYTLSAAIPTPPLPPITFNPWITPPSTNTLFNPRLRLHISHKPYTPKR
ncbi:hypothetical protein PIB30_062274 [Stylosanthes scabra]|uniref:Uncharacterized protein n=1 Tax=Stylosanthes scabra TaxID=79078 RepID=A0ABU6RLE1_9FABA|nr:hypothetical protein [Stylosanthes scabra]